MTDFAHQILAFNRGIISQLALARIDLKRMALSADTFLNWMPRVLGSMMLRPGTAYLGSTLNDAAPLHVDFVFSQDDAALLELTANSMRVRIDDIIVTRPAVTSTFMDWDSGSSAYVSGSSTSSTFPDSTDLNKWHDNDESGGASSVASGGGLQLLGTGNAAAVRDRAIEVSGTNVGKEHAITIVIVRGQCTLRIGSSEGDDSYLEDRTLRAGTHSIAITPSGTFYVRLSSTLSYACVVSSVTIAQAAGDMVLPTPWGASDLDNVRWDQSGDVVFVACNGIQQKRIERQDRTNSPASRSWSIVEYAPTDGPFGTLNVGPVQLKGTDLSGEITLISNRPFFKPSHVGGLFRLTSAGQDVKVHITGDNTFSNPIKVTGVGTTGRSFTVTLTGPTFTNTTTVTLQRSISTPGTWSDVATYTGVTSVSIYDNLDNQIAYYRIGVKTGQFTTDDDLTAELTFSAGSINGVVRVTGFTDNENVSGSVLTALGAANTFTQDWYEGDWSPLNGYPSSVSFFDGRLGFAGKGMVWVSISDLFDSFDDSVTDDSGPIRRFIGSGPVDQISWMLALNFLLIGTAGDILVAKASSIDDPITPTKFSLKPVSSVGAAPIRALKVDTNGILVARNLSRVHQLSADANLYSIVPYSPVDLTELVPEIGVPGFRRMAVQRHKDTRIHLVRTDGTVAVLVFDKAEQVTCWLNIQTDGVVVDVAVLPGTTETPLEDQVYYTVQRTIGGVTKCYVEKWALESQAVCATDNRIADSHVTVIGAGTTISAPHLAGKQVVLWLDGVCPMDDDDNPILYTVAGDGTITPDAPFTTFACAGLPYVGQWRSVTLAVGSRLQAPLNNFKNIDHISFVLESAHARGLKFGQDFDTMDGLPQSEDGAIIDRDFVWAYYNKPSIEFDGTWDTDPRICLQAQAPLGVTLLGMVASGSGHDK